MEGKSNATFSVWKGLCRLDPSTFIYPSTYSKQNILIRANISTIIFFRGVYKNFYGDFGRLNKKTGNWSGAIGEVGSL